MDFARLAMQKMFNIAINCTELIIIQNSENVDDEAQESAEIRLQ